MSNIKRDYSIDTANCLEMVLEHPKATVKNTAVSYNENIRESSDAPCDFRVTNVHDGTILADIHFQNGPIKEYGVNGIHHEDLIHMIICRLQHFQQGEFRCFENDMAINSLEETLSWLRKRNLDRVKRGVEGTSQI